MAAPTFRASSGPNNGNSGSPATVAKPTGVVDGDYMIAVTMAADSGDNGVEASAPAGWTLLDSYAPGTFRPVVAIYYKKAASEGSGYDFNNVFGDFVEAAIWAYTNVASSGLDAHAVLNTGVASTWSTPTGQSTTAADDLVVAIFTDIGITTLSVATPPSGMTNRTPLVLDNYFFGVYDIAQASAGAISAKTIVTTAAANYAVAFVVALKSAGGGGGGFQAAWAANSNTIIQ